MLRCPFVCAALLALAHPARGDQAAAPPETVVRLSVSPAPAPIPALRYTLLPELRELNPGNPCLHYIKCFLFQPRLFLDKEVSAQRELLLTLPHTKLATPEFLDYGGEALRQADWAARLDNPDWQVLLKLKSEGPGLLLSDLPQFETLASALTVRFRAEVAAGRFDDAIRTAKTLFALARQLGEHPTLVGNCTGFAVAHAALRPLREMLEQPGCPNLYWALTYMPTPLVSVEKGFAGERDIFLVFFRDLDDTARMSPDQIARYIAPLDQLLYGAHPVPAGRVRAWLDARTRNEEALRTARRRLVSYGIPEERLLQFPAEQVLLLDEKREYEVRRDDILKLIHLPTAHALSLAPTIQRGQETALFVEPMLEGLVSVLRGQGRLDREIALLRHVEALRLHAAEHGGFLPAALSEVAVPLPADPLTGRPFSYEVKDGTAHLHASPPAGAPGDDRLNVHYELTLRNPPRR